MSKRPREEASSTPQEPAAPEVTPHTCFVDPVWLQHNGGARPDNALAYFERSPFFERGEGLEFAVAEPVHNPRCVTIVRRRRRSDGAAPDVESYYYILDGTIYQCPSVDLLVRSRLRKCGHYLSEAFSKIKGVIDTQEREAAAAAEEPADAALPDDGEDLIWEHLSEEQQKAAKARQWKPPEYEPVDKDLEAWIKTQIPWHP